jgi:hypothetical protein
MKTPKFLLALLALVPVTSFGQPVGTPISQLPSITTVAPGDFLPIVDVTGSPYVTKKATVAQLSPGLGSVTALPNTLMLRDSSGNSQVNTLTINNTPVNPSDAVNKAYVDAFNQGLNIHNPAAAATTPAIGNINLSGGAPNTLDGVALSVDFRVLVKDQTDATQNGIYYVSVLGTGSNGTWLRTTDANSGTNLVTGSYLFITGGTVNGNASWVMVTPGPITIGVSLISWELFSQTTQILASNIIGQLIGSQIQNFALDYTKFASSIQPVGIVSVLPNPAGYTGVSVVFNTTDGNLYRYVGGAWTVAVPPQFTSQITGTSIANGTITTANLAANAVSAGQIAANAVTSGTIAANSITSGMIQTGAITASQISAGAITTNAIGAGQVLAVNIGALTITGAQIQAGTLTADKFNVNAISAISANIGTITAGILTANVAVDIGSGYNEVAITPGIGLQIAGGLVDFGGVTFGNPTLRFHGVGSYALSEARIATSATGITPPYIAYIDAGGTLAVNISEGGIFMSDTKAIQSNGTSYINLDGANPTAGITTIASTAGSAGALWGYFHLKIFGVGEVAVPYYHP